MPVIVALLLCLFGCEKLFLPKEKKPRLVAPEASVLDYTWVHKGLVIRPQSFDGIVWLELQGSKELNPKYAFEIRYGLATAKPLNIEACKSLSQGRKLKYDQSTFRLRLEGLKGKIKAQQKVAACLWQEELGVVYPTIAVATSKIPFKKDPKLPGINNYGRQCEAEIGPVPLLDCYDGELLDIAVAGVKAVAQKPQKECDNPVGLPHKGGQCVSGSYLLRTDTGDPDVELVMICRRYEEREPDSPLFDDIAIIHHRKTNGTTCFYQMPYRITKVDRIPPPAEVATVTPPNAMKAVDFWMTPEQTAERQCIQCHDSDPFLYNPWVAQAGILPSNPFGKYHIIGEAFQIWNQVYGVDTRGATKNKCTSCHRIGHMQTCNYLLDQSVGLKAPPGMRSEFFASAEAISMPPDHGYSTKKEWMQVYSSDLEAIRACCQVKPQPGHDSCKFSPILTFESR